MLSFMMIEPVVTVDMQLLRVNEILRLDYLQKKSLFSFIAYTKQSKWTYFFLPKNLGIFASKLAPLDRRFFPQDQNELTPDFTLLPTVLATLVIFEPCNNKEKEWSITINMVLIFRYLIKSHQIVLNAKVKV